MSTPTQARDKVLTLAEIDDVLRHWAKKLISDPTAMDPIDQWLDCRNRLSELDEQDG